MTETKSSEPDLLEAPLASRRRLQQRSTTTRAKLLVAARAVFVERGYFGAEVSDIVLRVPITKGALYHHFGSKEALFEEACDQIAREVHRASSDVVRQYSGDAWKQLIVSIQARFDIIASSPEAQKILLIDGPAVLGWRRWREIQADVALEPLQRTLDILIEQGRIPDQPTRPFAQLLLAALNDAALAVASSENPKSESVTLFAALLTMINGLRVPADEVSCATDQTEEATV
ncbi:TetR/AcrR family transcriptional regulator [Sphingomonas solaris]|uniref:TetR/AcrR family transcriptional regulator n=1 Tax=Alterirhizorhabdus solaris TaxID=2529389 RepID=A0A558R992_9SPHN|nr:TetR/AcrR family transcriptional regulator [Sphingomonas solaris]TVV75955.1 TetR/AcrR family transcriptional regulator [Sphingomonas solaris]